MKIEVQQIGDQFIAYDEKGNRITDRNILEAISFEQMPVYKAHYFVDIEIDNSQQPSNIQSIDINIQSKK